MPIINAAFDVSTFLAHDPRGHNHADCVVLGDYVLSLDLGEPITVVPEIDWSIPQVQKFWQDYSDYKECHTCTGTTEAPAPVPEPDAVLMVVTGMIACVLMARWRRQII